MTTIRIRDHHCDFTYTVDEQRVMAEGKIQLQGEQSFSFDLDQIGKIPIVLRRRYPGFRQGGWTLFLCLAALPVVWRLEWSDERVIAICCLIAGILVGLTMMATYVRPVQFITVINHAGHGLFSITRTSKNQKEVDELLGLLGI